MSFMTKDFDLPENIFYFHNIDLHPLTFVLLWDSEDKFFFRLLHRYMGNVIDKPDDHSLVLTVPKMNKYFHRFIPAFDIKYIEDCFKLKDYPDPTKYMIQDSCLINYKKSDIFDCWFHRNKSWIDFSPITTSIPKNILNQHKTNIIKNKVSCCTDIDDDVRIHAPSTVTSYTSNKKTRMPYTHLEDYRIVEYIVKHKGAFKVTGTDIWQQMERANVNKIRTWQSMKERYIKHIKWHLTSGCKKYPFLSKNDLKELRQGLKIEVSTSSQKEELLSKYNEIRSRNLYSDESD